MEFEMFCKCDWRVLFCGSAGREDFRKIGKDTIISTNQFVHLINFETEYQYKVFYQKLGAIKKI